MCDVNRVLVCLPLAFTSVLISFPDSFFHCLLTLPACLSSPSFFSTALLMILLMLNTASLIHEHHHHKRQVYTKHVKRHERSSCFKG